jgi:squalene cyclase
MPRKWLFATVATAAVAGVLMIPTSAPVVAAEEKKDRKKAVETAIKNGLEYLKKEQKPDGHWEAQGGQYPTTMTAVAGMCFLMEGSTLKEGKYKEQVEKAVGWFLAANRQQPNGMIGDPRNPTESTRYMYGQGFGTMFLASAYGEEDDKDQRDKLEKLLKKAVEFICKAQTSKKHKKPEGKEVEIGGWGYVSAADGGNFDEGSVTITALQALRAAKNAGIPVPKENIDKAVNYLEACTTPDGGVIYSYAGGGVAAKGQGRPPITAAAICCGFSAGQYKSELPKRWIKYCKDNIPVGKGRQSHDEYQTYYFAQAVYALGDDKYGEMFPNDPKDGWLTWSKYKDAAFQQILDGQDKTSGGWTGGYIGPVFATSVNLTVLQLEKGILPIYQK